LEEWREKKKKELTSNKKVQELCWM
jgi:hypothetical protein